MALLTKAPGSDCCKNSHGRRRIIADQERNSHFVRLKPTFVLYSAFHLVSLINGYRSGALHLQTPPLETIVSSFPSVCKLLWRRSPNGVSTIASATEIQRRNNDLGATDINRNDLPRPQTFPPFCVLSLLHSFSFAIVQVSPTA
jgi:hypothetical protein